MVPTEAVRPVARSTPAPDEIRTPGSVRMDNGLAGISTGTRRRHSRRPGCSFVFMRALKPFGMIIGTLDVVQILTRTN